MNLSIFEVLGPVMIGPSSSHTAGAAKLARVAMQIAGKPFSAVHFGLHGSFLQTGGGHGTRTALLAGVLGIREDDERLRRAFAIARERGVRWSFAAAELEEAHENTACIEFEHTDGTRSRIVGSSIGGGRIRILNINGMAADFSAEQPTLLVEQNDTRGVVSEVTTLLAQNGINIAVMRLARLARGETATTVLELDETPPEALVRRLSELPNVRRVCAVNV